MNKSITSLPKNTC